jgi:activator of HSP90 ATPase
MTTIHQEVTLKAAPERVYEAFMDTKQRTAFTGNAAEVSRDPGGAFTAHDGFVTGRNIELVPNQRIVQVWRFQDWPEGVYSLVKFELAKDGSGTRVVLDHTGIPDGHREHLETGWTARYWEPLKKYFA